MGKTIVLHRLATAASVIASTGAILPRSVIAVKRSVQVTLHVCDLCCLHAVGKCYLHRFDLGSVASLRYQTCSDVIAEDGYFIALPTAAEIASTL